MPASDKRLKREYSEAEIQQALKLYYGCGDIKEVSKQVGCPLTTLYGWLRRDRQIIRKQAEVRPFTPSDGQAEARKTLETRLLQAENQALRQMCIDYVLKVTELKKQLLERKL